MDGIFIGHGVGADGIAAVNIVVPVFLIATGIGLMLGIGSSVIASIRLSENNVKAARIIMTQSFVIGLLVMGIICLGCAIFPHKTVNLLGCTSLLEKNAIGYLLWILPGLPFLLVECIGMMLIRLDGSPKYAMSIQIVTAVLNISLDWYMVFPMGLGVMGAAMATSISCVVGGLMSFIYFVCCADRLRFYRLKLSVTSLLLTLRNTWYMSRIGFATFLSELAMGILILTGNYMFLYTLGEDGVAAYAVICYLFPVIFSISNAVAQSAQPIISYNYGAHLRNRVHRALNVSLFTAILCGFSVFLLLWLGATPTVGMFLSPQEKAFSIAVEGLPVFATCAVFFAVNIAFIGYYQSIEKATASTIYTLLRGIVFLVPSFILMPHLFGVTGLWLSVTCAEFLTCIVISLRYLREKCSNE